MVTPRYFAIFAGLGGEVFSYQAGFFYNVPMNAIEFESEEALVDFLKGGNVEYKGLNSFSGNPDSLFEMLFGTSEQGAIFAEQFRRAIQISTENIDDESKMMEMAGLYDEWSGKGVPYKKDKIIRWGLNSDGDVQLYKIIMDHTSQADWVPGNGTDSLYKKVGFSDDGHGIWTQPLGAHDAYRIGDIVWYPDDKTGKLYINEHDYNTYAPGVYGWKLYVE